MARSNITCDSCGKSIEVVKMKLFASPTHRHDDYTGHADLCDNCTGNILKMVKFQKRRKKAAKSDA